MLSEIICIKVRVLLLADKIEDEIDYQLLAITNLYEEQHAKFSEDTEGESTFQIILRSHLYIEHELRIILFKNVRYPDLLGDKLKFSDFTKLVFALGLLPKEEMTVIKKINNLRNQFAHNLQYTIEEKEIITLLDSVSPSKRKRFAKFNSTTTLNKLKDILFLVWTDLVSYNLIPKHVKEHLGVKDFE